MQEILVQQRPLCKRGACAKELHVRYGLMRKRSSCKDVLWKRAPHGRPSCNKNLCAKDFRAKQTVVQQSLVQRTCQERPSCKRPLCKQVLCKKNSRAKDSHAKDRCARETLVQQRSSCKKDTRSRNACARQTIVQRILVRDTLIPKIFAQKRLLVRTTVLQPRRKTNFCAKGSRATEKILCKRNPRARIPLVHQNPRANPPRAKATLPQITLVQRKSLRNPPPAHDPLVQGPPRPAETPVRGRRARRSPLAARSRWCRTRHCRSSPRCTACASRHSAPPRPPSVFGGGGGGRTGPTPHP